MTRSLTLLLPDGWRGEIVNLSATGLRVRTLAVVPRSTDLDAAIVLPDGEQIAVRGKVVWSTPPDHLRNVAAEFGLELVDVSEKYFSMLVRFFADQP
ncbi:MAG TPA: PilZ domain-containing protein [Myxococcaceae bacterium]|nr:PilZ domain-containing protein [Myxococcaceae bacterium]